jgi:hypothetical protein
MAVGSGDQYALIPWGTSGRIIKVFGDDTVMVEFFEGDRFFLVEKANIYLLARAYTTTTHVSWSPTGGQTYSSQ